MDGVKHRQNLSQCPNKDKGEKTWQILLFGNIILQAEHY